MADLAQALDAALQARYHLREVRSPITQRRGLLARMNQLEKLHEQPGDRPGAAGRRAAASAGIAPDTWTRWRKEQRSPSPASLRRLEGAYARQITLPKFRRAIADKKEPNEAIVSAEVWWTDSDKKNNGDQRTVRLRGLRSIMRPVILAWITTGPERAAQLFEEGAARVYAVTQNADDTPGIQFKGNDVTIEFP